MPKGETFNLDVSGLSLQNLVVRQLILQNLRIWSAEPSHYELATI
jgi:hypothetical protein